MYILLFLNLYLSKEFLRYFVETFFIIKINGGFLFKEKEKIQT